MLKKTIEKKSKNQTASLSSLGLFNLLLIVVSLFVLVFTFDFSKGLMLLFMIVAMFLITPNVVKRGKRKI